MNNLRKAYDKIIEADSNAIDKLLEFLEQRGGEFHIETVNLYDSFLTILDDDGNPMWVQILSVHNRNGLLILNTYCHSDPNINVYETTLDVMYLKYVIEMVLETLGE
jgi:hypothetical protein